VRQQPDERGVCDQRAGADEVREREQRLGAEALRSQLVVLARGCAGDAEDGAGGEQLHRRADQRVPGQRRARRPELAGGLDRRGGDEQQQPAQRRSAAARAGRDEQRHAAQPGGDRQQRRAPRALAVRESQQHDPQRHRRDDQRREAGGHLLLGEREQADVAEDHRADGRGAGELALRD
jgi:hypothetical protein